MVLGTESSEVGLVCWFFALLHMQSYQNHIEVMPRLLNTVSKKNNCFNGLAHHGTKRGKLQLFELVQSVNMESWQGYCEEPYLTFIVRNP